MNSIENVASILIVDDQPINIDILRRFLEPHHFAISAVTSGEQALEVTKKIDFDLILLDVSMPTLDGFETCIELKKGNRTKNIPVIFVTAKTDPADIKRGFMVGSADYITKPVHQDVVLVRVNNQLARIKQEKLEKRLLEAKKMAELGNMVASISHEVATPLSNLQLSIETLQVGLSKINQALADKILSSNMLNDYIDISQQGLDLSSSNIERAIELMSSFQNIAVGQGAKQAIVFNLSQQINYIKGILKPTLNKTAHSLLFNIPSTINMRSYPGALSQVIINMINNSLIHAFTENQKGQIEITASQNNDEVTITYSDNGKGINEAILPNVFTKFFSTNLGSGGSGLGLDICKNLIEQDLQGTIELESGEGKGVTFTLVLPAELPSEPPAI